MTTHLAAACLACILTGLVWIMTGHNPLAQLARVCVTLNAACLNTAQLAPRFYRLWRKRYPAALRQVHRDLSARPVQPEPAAAPVAAGILQEEG